jgi:hypothetical protein
MPEWLWFVLGALGAGLLWLFLELAGNIIGEIVLYCVGWCFLRLVTFGHYPPGYGVDKEGRIKLVGLVVLVACSATSYFVFVSPTSP